MTDAEIYDNDPHWFAHQVAEITSPRKLRLYMCGILRFADPEWKQIAQGAIVELAEEFADGNASKAALEKARTALRGKKPVTCGGRSGWKGIDYLIWCLANPDVDTGFRKFGGAVAWGTDRLKVPRWPNERDCCRGMMREVFGNPFRPVRINARWLKPAVLQLAQCIYEDRRFDELSRLADQLEEAGCANAEILDHCRSGAPHVRGCWAIDLILGKR